MCVKKALAEPFFIGKNFCIVIHGDIFSGVLFMWNPVFVI